MPCLSSRSCINAIPFSIHVLQYNVFWSTLTLLFSQIISRVTCSADNCCLLCNLAHVQLCYYNMDPERVDSHLFKVIFCYCLYILFVMKFWANIFFPCGFALLSLNVLIHCMCSDRILVSKSCNLSPPFCMSLWWHCILLLAVCRSI